MANKGTDIIYFMLLSDKLSILLMVFQLNLKFSKNSQSSSFKENSCFQPIV